MANLRLDPTLAGMVFKMRFLKTMTEAMTIEDLIIFQETTFNIASAKVCENDLKNLDLLFNKFRGRSNANKIP